MKTGNSSPWPFPRISDSGIMLYPIRDKNGRIIWVSIPEKENELTEEEKPLEYHA